MDKMLGQYDKDSEHNPLTKRIHADSTPFDVTRHQDRRNGWPEKRLEPVFVLQCKVTC